MFPPSKCEVFEKLVLLLSSIVLPLVLFRLLNDQLTSLLCKLLSIFDNLRSICTIAGGMSKNSSRIICKSLF